MRPLLAFVLVASSAAPSFGQTPVSQVEQLKQLSIEELAETQFTGSGRRSEELEEIAAAVTVITADDLRRYGVMNVAQALRLADTMQVAQVAGPSWAISPRGFNITTANKMLVMIDGRSVYSPVFGGMFWEAQDLVIADIARIEVVRGPGGTLWGANAVNGVVHIITKSAADTRGTFVNAAVGSELLGPFAIRHGGRFGRAGSYRAYAKFHSEDATKLAGGISADNQHDFGQVGFRIESERSAASHFVLQGDLFSGQTGLDADRHISLNGGNLLGRWTRRPGSETETTVQVYYDRSFRHVPAQYRGVLDTFDLDLQQQYGFGPHVLVVGGGYRQYRGDDRGEGPGFFFDPQQRVSHRSNVFAQAQFDARHGVFVTVGTKVEHNEFTGAELQPSVSARWTRRAQTLWGSVSRAVRVPTRFDTDLRIRNPNTGTVVLTGTEDFRSEVIVAYDAGYRTRLGEVILVDVAVFNNRYDDLRSQEFPTQPGMPIRLMNMLNAVTRGVETTSKAQVTPWWQIGGGYTYLWKQFTFDPASADPTGGAAEANDPSHIIKLRSMMNIGSRVEADAYLRYYSSLPMPPVDAYTEVDARVGYRVRPGWELALIGSNLLHKNHLEFRGGTPPQFYERAVTLRSTWRF
jgi:iron complex outermembrane receptor protein